MSARPPAVLFMGDLVIVARQLRLITEAHRRGYAPLLVVTPHTDPARLAELRADPEHPLSLLADVVEVADAKVDYVVPGIQPLLRRYDVRAVLCVGDFFVEPVGVVGDLLGVPGAGMAASRISRNKLLQRTALRELSPAFEVVTPADRGGPVGADLAFPVVVKPVARFSSLGVRQVTRREELPGVLATYPDDETVLVESRVVGPEFSVEALTQGGEVLWSGVTAKQTNESGGIFFTEMGHTSPAELSDADRDALVAANATALRRIGFRDGITHAEFRLSDDGPVMMEIATRLPGDGITFLWHLATGSPLEPVMIDLALGEPTSYPLPRRRAAQVYLDHPCGVLREVTSSSKPVSWVSRDEIWPEFTPLPADAEPSDHAVLVTVVPGDVLGPQTDSEARSASVVFDLPLGEPVEPLAKRYADTVRISVEEKAS